MNRSLQLLLMANCQYLDGGIVLAPGVSVHVLDSVEQPRVFWLHAHASAGVAENQKL